LFGAVTTADVAEAVKAATGAAVDRRKIEIGKPIKSTGNHTVSVRLHPEVLATVVLEVVAS
jgi:large subunit ribosomal protein L9